MAPSKQSDALATLKTTILNLKTLLHRFHAALQSPTPVHPPIEDSPNPLALLSDASQILKAQTTKLSLLILNKPFTASAIVLHLELSVQQLPPSDDERTRALPCRRIHQPSTPDEHGIEKTGSRDILASTGVLWAECDKVVALGSGGLTRLAAERIEEFHGLLKDAIAELEEWDPDEESESDTDSLTSNKGTTSSARPVDASLEKSLQGLTLSPVAALRKRTLVILRIIRLLYPALIKRRILTFSNINSSTTSESLPTSLHIQSLDALLDHTKQFTEETDEIAGALYAGDEEEVEDRLGNLAEISKICVEEVRIDWGGNEDEFTAWAEKWKARLEEVRRG
ncbi:hypothetical protein HO173_008068 [Letharia columbiana]|uniref:Uncharacterized protein n=1 Tax=Letharia columbiana TaxID=112416 RepID=A0A8H6FSG5_9LECA|nr:uncharacterized protein HO173_008068 [Letharia columbiana]KAF6233856.1 hypothetical protein HO173_008068 [Letharia columbiana]